MSDDNNLSGFAAPAGVMYVAFGAPYLAQALYSVQTLRQVNPTLPVAILSNCSAPDILPAFTTIITVDAPNSKNREFKSSVHRYSPFERTLFIDCDTEVKTDPEPGFRFLDKADIALRPEPLPYNVGATEMDPTEMERLTREIGEFNTGVIFFSRTETALHLLDAWNGFVQKRNDRDQKHLVRAIHATPEITIWPLAVAWNYMRIDVRLHLKKNLLVSDPYIWHYMDYSYSRTALRGVFKMADQIGVGDQMRNWAYVKKHVVRPFLTRYFFLKRIDRLRKVLRKSLKRLLGRK